MSKLIDKGGLSQRNNIADSFRTAVLCLWELLHSCHTCVKITIIISNRGKPSRSTKCFWLYTSMYMPHAHSTKYTGWAMGVGEVCVCASNIHYSVEERFVVIVSGEIEPT